MATYLDLDKARAKAKESTTESESLIAMILKIEKDINDYLTLSKGK